MSIRTEVGTFVELYRIHRRKPGEFPRWHAFRNTCWWMRRRWTDVPEPDVQL